jgi:uncharacterized delta-60 repeat protein
MLRRSRLAADRLDDRIVPAYALDPTFGTGGTSLTGSAAPDKAFTATATAALPDGSILVAGSVPTDAGQFAPAVMKLKPDGSVDTSFNGGKPSAVDGLAVADRSSVRMAVQPDGKILLGATVTATTGDADIAVVRLNADGSPDGQFGLSGGRVLALDLGGSNNDALADLKVMADGRIAVLGTSATGTAAAPGRDVTVTVLTAAGAVDQTYGGAGAGGTGTVRVDMGGLDTAAGLVANADGTLVIAATKGGVSDGDATAVAVVRLTPAGTVDLNYGGVLNLAPASGHADLAVGLTNGPNGLILLAQDYQVGATGTPGSAVPSAAVVARLAANGTLDTAFGTNGATTIAVTGSNGQAVTETMAAQAIALADGSVVVTSAARTAEITSGDVFAARDFAVTKLTSTGAVAGQTLVGFDTSTVKSNDTARAATVRSNGEVVVVGNSGDPQNAGPTSVAVAVLKDSPASPPPTTTPPTSPPPTTPPTSPPPTTPPTSPPPATSPPPGGAKAVSPPTWSLPDGQRVFASLPQSVVNSVTGDVTGDGVADYVFFTGAGDALARVYDGKTGAALTGEWRPYEARFKGGLNVAVGDVDGDGKAEIVFSPVLGGSARVQVYSMNGTSPALRANFFGVGDSNWRGGASVAVGDFNGDGKGDLAVGAGAGGGPRVALYDGSALGTGGVHPLAADFFALPDAAFRGGVNLAAGDFNGDGKADLAVGAGTGGGPRVRVLSGADLIAGTPDEGVLSDFFARGDAAGRGGIRVETTVSADGTTRLVTADKLGELVYANGSSTGTPMAVKPVVIGGVPRARAV